MALLSRVADRVHWGARYIERAEDTARVLRAFGDLYVDFPVAAGLTWGPLVAITGEAPIVSDSADRGEREVLHRLIADASNPGSIIAAVEAARENLRTTREVMPREAWLAINQIARLARDEAPRAVGRRNRDWFLTRVIEISRRLDGVLESTMTRDPAWHMWRLGRLVERADMTTRVLGVRAASLLRPAESLGADLADVQWMGVLRSLSALQMYQRAVRGPIEAGDVMRFLLFHEGFPRSVRSCLVGIQSEVLALPDPREVLEAVGDALAALDACDPEASDGWAIDADMDRLQVSLVALDRAIISRYFTW
ncbi:MAG: alpha-E domain-containing protein [Actinomycetota bacterium]|jgi:uncharacterized alpha-E superfamily protein|nr:alpha-E domain-containing protein [Actinomycetota bacterium]MDA3015639.1 alpha-E domain-containing protein [Actinomycetota bacterium]MDA3027472.1 alpha-E domain-containing protein [Actinomycetota bacterium]